MRVCGAGPVVNPGHRPSTRPAIIPARPMWNYALVLGALLLAGLGLPLPEEITLMTAGYFCAENGHVVPVMYAIGLLGILAGDLMLYGLGRCFGEGILSRWPVRHLVTRERLERWERIFQVKGARVVLAVRFIPAVRPAAYLAVGVLRFDWRRFLALDLLAALPFVALLLSFGYYFGEYKEHVRWYLRRADMLVVLLLLGAGIYLAVYRLTSHPRMEKEEEKREESRRSSGERPAV